MTLARAFELLPTFAASVLALLAALIDLRSRTIPNLLTLPLLCGAPLVRLLSDGPGALAHALLAALVCAAVPLLAFVRGALGGGDVKLFATLGALLGAERGLQVELVALLLAALYASVYLAWHGLLLRTLQSSLRLLTRAPSMPSELGVHDLPLAPAIALAVLASTASDMVLR